MSEIYDIATKHENAIRALEYPRRLVAPRRTDFRSNADYGLAMDNYERDVSAWRERVKEYNAAEGAEIVRFRGELLDALGVGSHPKAAKLWDLAWEEGHAYGLNEVAIHAERFAELLLPETRSHE